MVTRAYDSTLQSQDNAFSVDLLRTKALGAAVEVKPVPKTIAADKFNVEQIRQ
jgi:hypothetical protein